MRRIALLLLPLLLALPGAAQASGEGWFHADCASSHLAQVDPIVNPGTRSGHLHEFYGNEHTNAFTTPQRLLWHPETSCVRDPEEKDPSLGRADSSAYWTPALFDGDTLVRGKLTAGYSSGPGDTTQIRPFPAGLMVVAGTAATGQPREVNGQTVWRARCQDGTVKPGSSSPFVAPMCATPDLRIDVNFPDCWNGRELDSPNHQSHLAYSNDPGQCPPGYPVRVPRLSLKFSYPTTGGPGIRLAENVFPHADFINGWRPGKQEQLVRDCLNPDLYCGSTDGPVDQ